MEPFSALLLIVASHSVATLVSALSGSQELGGLSKDLFDALSKSEANIDERLNQIGARLDALLDKPYKDALARGMRRIDDLSEARRGRAELMEEARKAFDEAAAAAEKPFQQAIAERYVLLMLLALGRRDLAKRSLIRMEQAATAAAFEAMALTEWSSEYYTKLLHAESTSSISAGPRPTKEGREAALESMGMCGRLLGEAAALAPEFDLPQRAAPPKHVSDAGHVDWQYDPRPVRAAARLASRFEKPQSADPVSLPIVGGKPHWTFDIKPRHVLRVGSLSLEILPGGADSTVGVGRPSYVARLELSESLENPIIMHVVHAEYLGLALSSDLFSQARERNYQNLERISGKPVPRPPKIPPTFLGWTLVPPPTGTAMGAGMVRAELPAYPLARSALAGRGGIDPSTSAIRLNPAYTLNHFIIVTMPRAT
jgi:hypothetical protein